MSLIAEFTLSSPNMFLADALGALSGAEIEIQDEFATDPDSPFVLFWVRGVDVDEFADAAASDPSIADLKVLADAGTRRLYRGRIPPDHEVVLYETVVELGVVPIHAAASSDRWYLRMRFPDREAIASFRGACEDMGVTFCLNRLRESDYAADPTLTEAQRSAVTVAQSDGYYSVPRECDLAHVAGQLGISRQAASERLRRAHDALVTAYLERR